MNPELLLTKSLYDSPHRESVTHILAAALDAVNPEIAVRRSMQRVGNQLLLESQAYNLDTFNRILLIGFGKASIPMGKAAADILGEYLSDGVLITKGQITNPIPHVTLLEGAHPIPDQRSIDGRTSLATFAALCAVIPIR